MAKGDKNDRRLSALLFLIFFLFTTRIAGNPEPSPPADNKGKDLFEKAYSIEAKEPLRALELYKSALTAGIESKLERAANWRIFYLNKKLLNYTDAILQLPDLGSAKEMKNVTSSLYSEIQTKWNIGPASFSLFIKGLGLIHMVTLPIPGNPGITENTTPAIPEESVDEEGLIRDLFTKSLELAPKNALFRDEMVKALMKAERDELALQIISGYTEFDTKKELGQSTLLVEQNRYDEAKNRLLELAKKEEFLSPNDKFRILYLIAIIYEKENHPEIAIQHLRLSLKYLDADDAVKISYRISLILLKNKFPLQALALIRELPIPIDENERLLRLVLLGDIDGSESACAILKEKRDLILERSEQGKDSETVFNEAKRVLVERCAK